MSHKRNRGRSGKLVPTVITEKARRQGWVDRKNYRGDTRTNPKSRIPFRSRPYRSKSFSDCLNPLQGWLRKRAGLPWPQVMADLKQMVSGWGRHHFVHIVNEHLHDFVVVKPIFRGSQIFKRTSWGWERQLRQGEFYVLNNELRMVYDYCHLPRRKSKELTEFTHEGTRYLKVKGIWYWSKELEPYTRSSYDKQGNLVQQILPRQVKVQLSRKQLNSLGLKNAWHDPHP